MQVREAKDFLVRQAVEQARLERVSLSDLERRMMYFTEGPDAVENPIELNEEFEKGYDSNEYEAKISKLFSNAYKRLNTNSPAALSEWNQAVEALELGDHYLLVLCGRHFSAGQISASIAKLCFRLAVLALTVYVTWIGSRYLLRATGISATTVFSAIFVIVFLAVALRHEAMVAFSVRAMKWLIVFLIRR